MMKAHFIGLCGAGMSAVAYLMKQAGYAVTGSDAGFYPPISDYITKVGLTCIKGYAAANIPSDVDVIVIGKNAKLVPETNPEVSAAFDLYKDRISSFPEVLADLAREKERIVVAGSYGKSTLTSMITWCLVSAGKAPSYFIGAVPKNLETSSHVGNGAQFVFEGDEYPSANWDDRSKFLHYAPQTVVLTSACHDHVNIYPTLENYHAPFKELLKGLNVAQGTLVACTDEVNARDLYKDYQGNKVSYGLEGADWSAGHIEIGHVTSFDLLHKGRMVWSVETNQLGRHNIQNIVGAAAYLIEQDILTLEEFAYAISQFEGLTRRLDRKNEATTELIIYEGFGSSYEKARSAISAIKEHFPNHGLTVLFEPHTFTWRNRAALDQYKTAFEGTETVWLYAPPTQGANTHDQLSLDEIYQKTASSHKDVRSFTKETYKDIVSSSDAEKNVVLILSSGSFDGLLVNILAEAEKVHPKSLQKVS